MGNTDETASLAVIQCRAVFDSGRREIAWERIHGWGHRLRTRRELNALRLVWRRPPAAI